MPQRKVPKQFSSLQSCFFREAASKPFRRRLKPLQPFLRWQTSSIFSRFHGTEWAVFVDPRSSRGIEPFIPDEVKGHPGLEAIDRALGQGMRGAFNSRIFATYTGRFVVREHVPR